ncbi:HNH endonuclease family protein [Paeniglutamicibacter cryotolerans]|uniref:GmrSD restriction endonucleases C-terminal domain-containing protein n=1 Tax=Paeniglutamicibacter cryotolerans TaxID=670079 RepID=A0A839QJ50_9MICC|nr:HNH endonuclease family protein [Paeniglutamicibacter cryotolerans]MBB2995633.1 hypothetical protein [Paeniglutamicibacter cryotolerans]
MKLRFASILSALALAGAVVLVPGTGPVPQTTSAPLLTAPSAVAATGSARIAPGPRLAGPRALSLLEALPVKGKAAATGYNRNAKFGNGWKDFNGNKCDERQDSLKRDMSKVKYKDKKKCQVASGRLHDAYTGKVLNWKVNSGLVDIDHVVALKNVWISGGQKLSQTQRLAVANDPLNLMASAASANRSKGDKNAAEWLPKNKSFRCQYVSTQISVKKKYALSVTSAEKAAMKRVLRSCSTQKAAKVTAIKPAGGTGILKPTAPAKPGAATTVKKKVSPGAFCAQSEKGKKGLGKKNGKLYICKASTKEARLRWRR